MDRNEFVQKFDKVDKVVSREELRSILDRNIESTKDRDTKRGQTQSIITMEEISEMVNELCSLSSQVSKDLRGKQDLIGLLEETADVLICIEYLKLIFGISDEEIAKAVTVKISRIDENLRKRLGE